MDHQYIHDLQVREDARKITTNISVKGGASEYSRFDQFSWPTRNWPAWRIPSDID